MNERSLVDLTTDEALYEDSCMTPGLSPVLPFTRWYPRVTETPDVENVDKETEGMKKKMSPANAKVPEFNPNDILPDDPVDDNVRVLTPVAKVSYERIPGMKNGAFIDLGGEDHTLGNLITCHLNKHPAVTFAAYTMPNPQKEALRIRIHTDGTITPKAVFALVCQRLIRDCTMLNINFTREWELFKMRPKPAPKIVEKDKATGQWKAQGVSQGQVESCLQGQAGSRHHGQAGNSTQDANGKLTGQAAMDFLMEEEPDSLFIPKGPVTPTGDTDTDPETPDMDVEPPTYTGKGKGRAV
ncbi:RBP11-like subunits of RNA polymerase [Trichodelitschia bisporula]|uniref:RBP11-like subunits of RNA polymerase n=1 Tax=Trichodelitschia bisporula TaxID=703511 RepID=A0A6G1IB39_9PEZI|nr:RBP11-like subunits of RNA polymerase [Trichodelitschia bisporula]